MKRVSRHRRAVGRRAAVPGEPAFRSLLAREARSLQRIGSWSTTVSSHPARRVRCALTLQACIPRQHVNRGPDDPDHRAPRLRQALRRRRDDGRRESGHSRRPPARRPGSTTAPPSSTATEHRSPRGVSPSDSPTSFTTPMRPRHASCSTSAAPSAPCPGSRPKPASPTTGPAEPVKNAPSSRSRQSAPTR